MTPPATLLRRAERDAGALRARPELGAVVSALRASGGPLGSPVTLAGALLAGGMAVPPGASASIPPGLRADLERARAAGGELGARAYLARRWLQTLGESFARSGLYARGLDAGPEITGSARAWWHRFLARELGVPRAVALARSLAATGRGRSVADYLSASSPRDRSAVDGAARAYLAGRALARALGAPHFQTGPVRADWSLP